MELMSRAEISTMSVLATWTFKKEMNQHILPKR